MNREPKIISVFHTIDTRGEFSKPYSYAYSAVPFKIRELFWTTSRAGTVRGFHCQTPPTASQKLVWVSAGGIIDVLVDLRKGPTYGEVRSFSLTASTGDALLVPVGFGHGFQALTENTIVNYATDREYDPKTDTGINIRSIEFKWPLPISSMSERDLALEDFDAFESPF